MRRYETEEEKEILVDNYVNKKWGLLKSGAQFGISKSCTKRILINCGVKIRTNSECQRKYTLNELFFDTENADMAYILGFIAADGSIRQNSNEIKITLANKDKEILEKIKEKIESSRPLREYTDSKGYEQISLDFCSQKIQNRLAEYGITPQKTTKLMPPIKLKDEFIVDYIRGYFDGDGCITSTGYKSNGLEWKIVSASKIILDFFEDYFLKYHHIPKIHISYRKKIDGNLQLYDLKYSTNFSKEMYKILYTPNTLYLKRKKDKYEELLLK